MSAPLTRDVGWARMGAAREGQEQLMVGGETKVCLNSMASSWGSLMSATRTWWLVGDSEPIQFARARSQGCSHGDPCGSHRVRADGVVVRAAPANNAVKRTRSAHGVQVGVRRRAAYGERWRGKEKD